MNQTQIKKLKTILESGNHLLTLKETLDIVIETKLPEEIVKLLTATRQRVWEMFIAEQEESMRSTPPDKAQKTKDQSATP